MFTACAARAPSSGAERGSAPPSPTRGEGSKFRPNRCKVAGVLPPASLLAMPPALLLYIGTKGFGDDSNGSFLRAVQRQARATLCRRQCPCRGRDRLGDLFDRR